MGLDKLTIDEYVHLLLMVYWIARRNRPKRRYRQDYTALYQKGDGVFKSMYVFRTVCQIFPLANWTKKSTVWPVGQSVGQRKGLV